MSTKNTKTTNWDTALSTIEEPISKPKRHMNLLRELNDIYTRKNHDYGDSFHETF